MALDGGSGPFPVWELKETTQGAPIFLVASRPVNRCLGFSCFCPGVRFIRLKLKLVAGDSPILRSPFLDQPIRFVSFVRNEVGQSPNSVVQPSGY